MGGRMRTEDILGYGTMGMAFIYYYSGDVPTAQVWNLIAVGLFLGSMFNQYKARKEKQKLIDARVEARAKQVVRDARRDLDEPK